MHCPGRQIKEIKVKPNFLRVLSVKRVVCKHFTNMKFHRICHHLLFMPNKFHRNELYDYIVCDAHVLYILATSAYPTATTNGNVKLWIVRLHLIFEWTLIWLELLFFAMHTYPLHFIHQILFSSLNKRVEYHFDSDESYVEIEPKWNTYALPYTTRNNFMKRSKKIETIYHLFP